MNFSFIPFGPFPSTRSRDVIKKCALRSTFYNQSSLRDAHNLRMTTTEPDSKEDGSGQLHLSQDSPQNSPAIVQIGCGADLHGQDVTVASVRACRSK